MEKVFQVRNFLKWVNKISVVSSDVLLYIFLVVLVLSSNIGFSFIALLYLTHPYFFLNLTFKQCLCLIIIPYKLSSNQDSESAC
jgi:hypothetical protein